MPLDDKNECKGFAFVEYEDEVRRARFRPYKLSLIGPAQVAAQAALALNNSELKKRHISVTIAQPRARGTNPK